MIGPPCENVASMMRSMALPVDRLAATWRSVRLLDCQSPGLRTILEIAAEAIAAFARDHVQTHAAGRGVGADAGGLIADLGVHRIVEVGLHRAVALQPVDHHAVDHDRVVRGGHAVRGHVGLLHRARAAGVRQVQVDARNQLADALHHAARRHRVDQLAIEHLRVHRGRRVDDRRRARDGDGFGQLADL